MTTNVLASFELLDANGEIGSFDVPITNSSNLLADIQTFISNLAVKIDLVTDCQITKIRFSVLVPLPGGIKGTPTAGAEMSRTGLLTFLVTGSTYAYGVDTPGWIAAGFTGNQVNQVNANVAAFITYLETTANNCSATDKAQHVLASVKRGIKTFRKHRRALSRA